MNWFNAKMKPLTDRICRMIVDPIVNHDAPAEPEKINKEIDEFYGKLLVALD